ncbi:MAG: hypothetical protein J6S67_12735 [Methanobrevibacter sp.]|nr:hypothetical protein [Methanobrevibacter sp.]
MRRCYYCGAKKQDDLILCPKCEKELKERMEKQNDKRRTTRLVMPIKK